jgi:cellulose biosynthesis protein BcsQ
MTVFVDTPGSLMPIITDAIEAADLIVLPTQPSPLDLHAQDAVAASIEKLGLRDKIKMVLLLSSFSASSSSGSGVTYWS